MNKVYVNKVLHLNKILVLIDKVYKLSENKTGIF